MSKYTFVCENCENEVEKSGSLMHGPPNVKEEDCPSCGASGTLNRLWTAPGVVWKATGGTRGVSDTERQRGEFVVDRK